jgi:RNA polymerase sigma-70 factor (ECF subfamily)
MQGACSADEAMARYAAGDDAAFARLYATLAPHLTRFFSGRLSDRTRVPDLVQETFLRIHLGRASFLHGSAVMPWAQKIARHLLIDFFRSNARQEQARVERLERAAGHAADQTHPTGEQIVAVKQIADRLDRAFAAVSEPQRAALRLVRYEGLSVKAAAAALGTTPIGIRLRTHRACRALRAGLGELAGAPLAA